MLLKLNYNLSFVPNIFYMRPQLLYLHFLCVFSFRLFSPQKWIPVVFIHKLNLCIICVVECLHA